MWFVSRRKFEWEEMRVQEWIQRYENLCEVLTTTRENYDSLFTHVKELHEALEHRDQIADGARLETRRIKVELERAIRELQEARDTYLHRLQFKRVAVNLHSPEMTIEGVLAAIYDDAIVLRHATTLAAEGATEQLVGDQVIPKEQIGFVTDFSADVRA